MEAFKQSIIIDIDGTLYSGFCHDDKKIISKIFENCRLVILLDRILWKINSLDFISNSMLMLNLRLMIYSILSFKNFQMVKEEYKFRYQNLLSLELQEKKYVLHEISKKYNIILITNNEFAIEVLGHRLNFDLIYAPNGASRRKQIRQKNYLQNINFVIGNNYMDDIFLAKRINALSIYVGKSVICKRFKADFNVSIFNEIMKIKKDGSGF